jgi:hypothetical protein
VKLLSYLNWPTKPKPWEHGGDASNTFQLCLLNRKIGLTWWKDTKEFSVDLSHPLAPWWLKIFEPIWKQKRAECCPVCNGSGWDGETYALTCECGGTGKPKKQPHIPSEPTEANIKLLLEQLTP